LCRVCVVQACVLGVRCCGRVKREGGRVKEVSQMTKRCHEGV
jgi:hypothetical protein